MTNQPEIDAKDVLAQECYDHLIATIRNRATSDWKSIIRIYTGKAYTFGFEHCLGMVAKGDVK